MGNEENRVVLRIGEGALLNVPVWHDHKRARNWWAKITIDPQAPGGLAREFAEKARGREHYYIVPEWAKRGTPVEFGADHYSGSGRKYPSRWYGYIEQASADAITLVKCETAREAAKQAMEMLEKGKEGETNDATQTAWW